jgi:hypothetical protein
MSTLRWLAVPPRGPVCHLSRSERRRFAEVAFGAFVTAVLLVAIAAQAYPLRADESNSDRRPAMIARIDALLAQRWEAEGVQPALPSDDSEFARRVYLDLTGVIPRVAEVRQFLEDARPDKRERLIDQLLASPRYPTHLASTWRQVMVPGGFGASLLTTCVTTESSRIFLSPPAAVKRDRRCITRRWN